MNNIVDFYTEEVMTQEDAELVLVDDHSEAMAIFKGNTETENIGVHAQILSNAGYKTLHVDDMIDICRNVHEVKMIKRVFDCLECELVKDFDMLKKGVDIKE